MVDSWKIVDADAEVMTIVMMVNDSPTTLTVHITDVDGPSDEEVKDKLRVVLSDARDGILKATKVPPALKSLVGYTEDF